MTQSPISSAIQSRPADWLEHVAWDERGLAPAIAQCASSGRVLTLAWMNRAALRATVDTGFATYWSRSRARLWCKGETSGHRQRLVELRLDCDNDAVLLQVEQVGGVACHTGRVACFFQVYDDGAWITRDPVLIDPETMYGPHE